MRIEDQVCSLEYAKKLKELGLKQESYFKWEDRECGYTELYHSKTTSISQKYFSAYSVAELGEMLIGVIRIPDLWLDTIEHPENLKEADMRANILICAIEHNLITEEWRKQWLEE